MQKHYTFYTKDGQRKVCFGADPAEAYKALGHKDMEAIDFHESGVTNKYVWNKVEERWEPRTAQHHKMTVDNMIFMLSKEEVIANIKSMLMNTDINRITVTMENKDIQTFAIDWHHYIFGMVQVVMLSYGEYHEGSYTDTRTPESDHHYLMMNSQYFSPSNLEEAIGCFYDRVKGNENKYESETLEGIHELQCPDTLYGDLAGNEKIYLLAYLLKCLDQHPSLVIDGYISRTLCYSNYDVKDLYKDIDYYCDQLLITKDGQRNGVVEDFITTLTGYKFYVGEQDSCGVLTMIIKLNSGKYVYG